MKYRLKSDPSKTCEVAAVGSGPGKCYEIRMDGHTFTIPWESFDPCWDPVPEGFVWIEDRLDQMAEQLKPDQMIEQSVAIKDIMSNAAAEIRSLRAYHCG